MIYPKFSQRYLAVIVVCLILTFSALGAVFLIYLFNEGSSPLVLTSGGGNGGLTILKPASSIIEGGIIQGENEKRNYFHQEQERIVTMNSNENNDNKSEIPYENDEFDEKIDDNDQADDHMHQLLQQQEKHNFMNNMRYKLYSITSTADEKETKINEQLHSNNNNSAEDKINLELKAYTKDIIDDDDMPISATSVEILQQPQQNHNSASSRDNFDTIYIDDFDRINNNMHVNKIRGESKLISDVNEMVSTERSYINYFDAVVSDDDANGDINIINDKHDASEASYSTATTSSSASDIAIALAPTELLVTHKNQKEGLKRDRQHISMQQKHDGKSNNNKNYNSQQNQQKFKQKLQKHTEDNLDTIYDNANNNYEIVEDDDDEDEYRLVNCGSGSGDSDTTNIKQNMKTNFYFQPNVNSDNIAKTYDGDVEVYHFSDVATADTETANFHTRISLKMFQRMVGKNNNRKNRRNPKIKYLRTRNQTGVDQQRRLDTKLDQQQQKFHTKTHNKRIAKKLDMKKKSTQNQRMFSSGNHNYNFSREVPSNLSTAQWYQGEKFITRKTEITGASATSTVSAQSIVTKPADATTAFKFELNNNSENKSKSLMLFTTSAPSTTAKYRLPFTATTAATRVGMLAAFGKDKNEVQPQQAIAINIASANMPTIDGGIGVSNNANSAAWSETRTRRIIGNVRKSEERSRQLLLCEEAGGGELCRMLFKGHLNE